jgi:hypothetical protein
VIVENVGAETLYFLIDYVGLLVYGRIVELNSFKVSDNK